MPVECVELLTRDPGHDDRNSLVGAALDVEAEPALVVRRDGDYDEPAAAAPAHVADGESDPPDAVVAAPDDLRRGGPGTAPAHVLALAPPGAAVTPELFCSAKSPSIHISRLELGLLGLLQLLLSGVHFC